MFYKFYRICYNTTLVKFIFMVTLFNNALGDPSHYSMSGGARVMLGTESRGVEGLGCVRPQAELWSGWHAKPKKSSK